MIIIMDSVLRGQYSRFIHWTNFVERKMNCFINMINVIICIKKGLVNERQINKKYIN